MPTAKPKLKKVKGWGDYLTKEQVQSLPVGIIVFIEWSGGNKGEYTIHETPWGEKICQKYNPNHGWFYGQIDFVGTERYHTKVRLKVPKGK